MLYPSMVLMFLMLCSSIPLLQGCTFNRDPKIVFPEREFQFPAPFIVGSEIVTTFSFTNGGNAPLHIQKIDSDCGCVATNTSSDKILPGGEGEIRVAVERDVGGFHQNVFVFTDDPVTPIMRLEVSGVIVPLLLIPRKLIWNNLKKDIGSLKRLHLQII